MFRKIINPIVLIPLGLFFTTFQSFSSPKKDYIDEILEEKKEIIVIDYEKIENFVMSNNQELKSLQEKVNASNFNLLSKVAKRYPKIDFQVNGIPKYVVGRNYNSNAQTTKTSQFSVNPSLNLRLDLIDPIRGSEIKIAKDNYQIAKNNYDIKSKDLVKEAKARYHLYQKSAQDIKNKESALKLSIRSLNDAKTKLDAGIGTKFEVLEADTQLSRDKQLLNETQIQHQINQISLKEILNISDNFITRKDQSLIGFWSYGLNKNIKNGLEKNLSLKNSFLQKIIKERQAKNYLNSTKPNIYISNSLSSTFSKGDSLATQIDPKESGSSYSNTISLNLTWNFFNGGQNQKSYKSSSAEAKSEMYTSNNLINLLEKNISNAYLNLKINEDKILSSLKEIKSSKESLRLSRLRYDVGISTFKDVLTRQKELSNAKSKNINAIYNYNLNLDELERLTFLEISQKCLDNNNNKIKDSKSICNISR